MSKYILLIMVILAGCGGNSMDYKYTAKVTYMNGDVDTLSFGGRSVMSGKMVLILKTSENNFFGQTGSTPCLAMATGFRIEAVVCGVRKYKILSETKEPAK